MSAAQHHPLRHRAGASLHTGRHGLRRLAAALLAATAWAAGQPAARAQAAPADAATHQRFDIPSQPLASALLSYTASTGLQLVMSGDIARDRTAPALHGSYTRDEALTRLLAGSGLGWRPSGNTLIVSRLPAAASDATTLDPIRVQGASETVRYVVDTSGAGTKTDARLIETPQSISVVTRQQMDDQAVQNVRQALRYTPGLTAEYRGAGGSRYDTVIYRGFGGGINYDYAYLDGMRLLGTNYAIPQIDTYNLERIEVLRGPSSVLFGQGTPGGLINLVSKKPTATPLHEIELQAGSHSFGQAAFDFGGPVDDAGKVLYRLTGVAHTGKTQIDYQKDERVAIAPAVTFRPNADTSLTLLAQYQHDPYGGYFGFLPAVGTIQDLPGGGRIGRRFFDGSPRFDEFKRTQTALGYLLEHRIDEVWSVQSNLRYMQMKTDYKSVYTTGLNAADPANSLLTRRAIVNHANMDAVTTDNHAQARFNTGALAHTALFGIDYQRLSYREDQGMGAAPSLSINRPDYDAAIATPSITVRSKQTLDQIGLYAQDQVKLGQWTLLGGIRQDWTGNDRRNRIKGDTTNQSDRAFTWRLGSVYEFSNGVAPYVSYSRSFQPVADADAQGNLFKPTKGEQYEAGIKYQPPGHDAFVSAAVYQLTQSNVLTTDPANTNYSIQTGEVRSRGLELEGKASLTRNLDLLASYTLMDNVNTRSTTAQGKHPTYVSRHSANAWANYTFHSGALAGLSLGGGVRYVGSSYANADNTLKVSPFTVVDAAVRYDLGQAIPSLKGLTAGINASNLFDREYVSACATATKCFYGAGRTVIGTLTYRW
ncbi:TonB-dependent siderophore receptor [Achromobacter xylosoxidans]|uniref:TonB-dependent siderophore receptor n=2 Tax=Alcaligenes xylosoxydans xylosoxydans TaxID=85698 RepID=UPI0004B4C912|nr:TonB-dependent siderophore receptor [Achromobacter xylosoxidans]MCH4594815.1 TonB-dependent siderophore receptor [Achromobacter xylosoxidans]CUI73735.1 Ferric hydroxamate uptake [Achromobacter xylosoxidans]